MHLKYDMWNGGHGGLVNQVCLVFQTPWLYRQLAAKGVLAFNISCISYVWPILLKIWSESSSNLVQRCHVGFPSHLNLVTTVAADPLAPYIARPSAAKLLTVCRMNRSLQFRKAISILLVSSVLRNDKNANISSGKLYPMMTSSNRNIFSALLALFVGNSMVTGEFPSQRPVTQSFDVFFDLRLHKRLSKQSGCQWFETQLRSYWRHCNAEINSAQKGLNISTHCGLVMPYGDRDLGQHWLR